MCLYRDVERYLLVVSLYRESKPCKLLVPLEKGEPVFSDICGQAPVHNKIDTMLYLGCYQLQVNTYTVVCGYKLTIFFCLLSRDIYSYVCDFFKDCK
jgi:hypothetical protein